MPAPPPPPAMTPTEHVGNWQLRIRVAPPPPPAEYPGAPPSGVPATPVAPVCALPFTPFVATVIWSCCPGVTATVPVTRAPRPPATSVAEFVTMLPPEPPVTLTPREVTPAGTANAERPGVVTV